MKRGRSLEIFSIQTLEIICHFRAHSLYQDYPTLPLNTPIYPQVPDLPRDLHPLDMEEEDYSLFPSVPQTEPGSDEDDIYVTLKPPKTKKKPAAVIDM